MRLRTIGNVCLIQAHLVLSVYAYAWASNSKSCFSRRRIRQNASVLSVGVSSDHDAALNNNLPAPWVWRESSSNTWQQESLTKEALETWNWCRHFVWKLQLCPWTKHSLSTKGALQIFLSTAKDEVSRERQLYNLSDRFDKFCQENPSIESSAIFFVVFLEDSSPITFPDFYDWFEELEDTWEDDEVIVAPFHPDWQFAGEPESLQFEKKSPHPTVSIVSSDVVEKAGENVTRKIGLHNQEVLSSQSADELLRLWKESLEVASGWKEEN